MSHSKIEVFGFEVEAEGTPSDVIEITGLRLVGPDGEFAPSGVLDCSHTPAGGDISSLQNGALGSCSFFERDMASPGFRIQWVLSAPTEVLGVAVSVSTGRILRFDISIDGIVTESLPYRLQLVSSAGEVRLNLAHLVEDEYLSSVVVALDFEGADQAPSLTYMGSAAVDSTKAVAGSSSLRVVQGTGNYLRVTGVSWTPVWTLEGWINKTSVVSNFGGQCIFRTSSGSVISVYMREGLRFCIFQDTSFFPASVGNVVLNEWAHFAAVATGAVVALYIDGIKVGESAYTKTPSGDLWIGGDPYPNQSCAAFFDCLKLTLGVARYSANFQPARGPANTLGPATLSEERPIQSRGAQPLLAARGGDPEDSVSTSLASQFALDVEHGGNHCIYGTVELYAQAGNIPLPRRVRLHRSRDGLLVRETWSDAQGNYRFEGITDRYTYDVIAWDHEGLQQSVVANDLTPEVMP